MIAEDGTRLEEAGNEESEFVEAESVAKDVS